MAYAKVEETFWHDPKVRALSERARSFFLYLLTSPHRNRIGCFVLDPFYAAADIQWTPDQVTAALEELERADRVSWDREHRVVLLRRFLKYNVLENGKVVVAACRELSGVPDTPLLADVLASLNQHRKPHYRQLIDAVGSRLPNHTANGSETLLPPTSPNCIGNDTSDGMGNGMAFPGPGPGSSPCPGSSPLPDEAPDRSLTGAVAVPARDEPGADPHDLSVDRSGHANGGTPDGDPLAGFNAIGSRLAALQLPGGYQAAAELVRERFLFGDDDFDCPDAEPSIEGLPLERREQIVLEAIGDYRVKHQAFDPRLFAGFVRRAAAGTPEHQNGNGASAETGITKRHLELAKDPEPEPTEEQRAEISRLASERKAALKAGPSVPPDVQAERERKLQLVAEADRKAKP